jgi:GTP-binding protein
VDVSQTSGRPDPVHDFQVIVEELESYGAGLETKPMIVAASKMDIADKKKLAALRKHCTKKRLKLFPLSAVTGAGLEELKYELAREVEKLRRIESLNH